MKLIYITHWRIPSEKTMAPYMMRVAEAATQEGASVEFWAPKRRNKSLQDEDSFSYHAIEPVFKVRYLPVIDVMGIVPGAFSFYLLLASWVVVLWFAVLGMKDRKQAYFYFFDLRDAVTVALLSKRTFSEIHMYYRSSLDFINRFVFKRLAGVVVPTKPMLEDITTWYGIPPEKMVHEPCGVNFERFGITLESDEARHTLGLPLDQTIVLYVGHLFPVKGVYVLLEAHAFLAPGEVIYVVGGTDDDIVTFRNAWEKAGSPKNVVIVGRRPHQEIPTWLRAADMLSIPNTAKEPAGSTESSPSKQMEYMASGRPLIASDVPGIRDVMDDTMAFYVTPDSPEAIAKAVAEIRSHPEEARARTQAAREKAKTLGWRERAGRIRAFMERRTY